MKKYYIFFILGLLSLDVFSLTYTFKSEQYSYCPALSETIKYEYNKSKVIEVIDLSSAGNRLITKNDGFAFKIPDIIKGLETTTTIVETERNSRLYDDLKVVEDIFKDTRANINVSDATKNCIPHIPIYKRSKIMVYVENYKKPPLIRSFTTGPREPWYFSADLIVTNIKQLRRDNGKLVEKEKPTSFYLGFNYKLFGDVYNECDEFSFKCNVNPDMLSIKFMMQASEKPANSLGIGVGYNLSIADVFIARIRTKDDSSVGENIGGTYTTVWGVSFNVGRGLEWIMKK